MGNVAVWTVLQGNQLVSQAPSQPALCCCPSWLMAHAFPAHSDACPAPCLQIGFSGWARMAQVIDKFAVTEVRKPKVGENKPAAVTGELRPGVVGTSRQADWLLGLQIMWIGWLLLGTCV